MLLRATHTPLLTYEHTEGPGGSRLVPGLAEALPRVSRDGRTYVLRLRAGLRYSNGRAVRARDFEHALKRVCSSSPAARRSSSTSPGPRATRSARAAGAATSPASGRTTGRGRSRSG
jgi:peptide/nickel transport system substrate-binding protein